MDRQGKTLRGVARGKTPQEAAAVLRAEGMTVLSLRPDLLRSAAALQWGKRPEAGELAAFARQLAMMLGAGIPILAAIEILEEQCRGKTMGNIAARVGSRVQGGQSLGEALAPERVPEVFRRIVEAGEVGGTLDASLLRLAGFYEREERLAQKISSASTYPAIVLVVALGAVIFLVTFVLPTYVSLFSQMGASLPWPTRVVLGFSHFLTAYWYTVPFILAGIYFLGRGFARWEKTAGLWDRALLRAPVLGNILIKYSLSRFGRTLSSLHKGGVSIATSLTLVEKSVGNRLVASVVRRTRQRVLEGGTMAEPLRESGIFPGMAVQMIRVGEETGDLEGMLSKVADIYDEELERIVDRLSSILEPVLIVFLGAVVGFILVSIVTPMFEMYQIVH